MNNELYLNLRETLSTADPNLHRVLIIGGGAAGLELATRLGHTVGRRRKASVTLLDKSRLHVWKPLLHEIASGSLDGESDALELIAHARWHGYRYRIGAMQGLNRAKRQVYVAPSFDDEGREVIRARVLGYVHTRGRGRWRFATTSERPGSPNTRSSSIWACSASAFQARRVLRYQINS